MGYVFGFLPKKQRDMNSDSKKIPPWKLVVVFGTMLAFDLGIPSIPGKHHLIYWTIACVIEAVICALLLFPSPLDHL
jgi:hypothetical protein